MHLILKAPRIPTTEMFIKAIKLPVNIVAVRNFDE